MAPKRRARRSARKVILHVFWYLCDGHPIVFIFCEGRKARRATKKRRRSKRKAKGKKRSRRRRKKKASVAK